MFLPPEGSARSRVGLLCPDGCRSRAMGREGLGFSPHRATANYAALSKSRALSGP